MKHLILIITLAVLSSCNDNDNDVETPNENQDIAMPAEVSGLTLSLSTSDFDTSYMSLRDAIDTNENLQIVAEVDHMANATSVNLELNSTRIIFFGNPNLGTPLMQRNQLAGLDLPQKIITYQDDNDDVYLGFNSTNYLTDRHLLEDVDTLPTISNALTGIITGASGGDAIISPNTTVFTGDQIITKISTQSFDDTYSTLRTTIDNNENLRIVAEVNHQENAMNVNMELRPTRLIIFGNPNLGTPLMQNSQTTAIDLPQKMLVWEDENGTVNVSYNSPDFLQLRHNIEENDMVLETILGALDNISNSAAGL